MWSSIKQAMRYELGLDDVAFKNIIKDPNIARFPMAGYFLIGLMISLRFLVIVFFFSIISATLLKGILVSLSYSALAFFVLLLISLPVVLIRQWRS